MIREALRTEIPRDASVCAQFDLFCQLPYRLEIYPLAKENLPKAEYWVFDIKGFYGDQKGSDVFDMLREMKPRIDRGELQIVRRSDGFIIIRNPGAASEPAPDSPPG